MATYLRMFITMMVNQDVSSEDFRAIYSSGKFKKFGQMLFNVNTR